jgi:hypothetical protein
MIAYYDIVIAVVFAWILLNVAFIPYIGFIAAYAMYEYVWDAYCQFRLEQERGK